MSARSGSAGDAYVRDVGASFDVAEARAKKRGQNLVLAWSFLGARCSGCSGCAPDAATGSQFDLLRSCAKRLRRTLPRTLKTASVCRAGGGTHKDVPEWHGG